MLPALRRLPLLALTQVLVVVTVVLFALGSGSVSQITVQALRLRWVALLALFAAALLLAVARGRRPAVGVSMVLAAALGALGLLSAAWSVAPRMSVERGGSFVILLIAAGALGVALRGDAEAVDAVLLAVLGAAVLVCLGGLVVLAFDSNAAVQAGTATLPARWKGLGQNPNTVSMLAALASPLALRYLLEGQGRGRAPGALAFVVLYGTVVASGSRGALASAAAGLLLAALFFDPVWTRRLATSAAVVLLLIGGVAVNDALLRGVHAVPPATSTSTSPSAAPGTTGTPAAGAGAGTAGTPPIIHGREVGSLAPMEDEIGSEIGGAAPRTLFGGSGRAVAWQGAIDEGNHRPLLGFGFGTEERVFVDRYYFFQGSRPENSYIGLYLQLGIVGVLLFVALGVALLVRFLRAARGSVATAAAGAVLAGFALGMGQSYVYSVGNIATVAFWVVVAALFAATAGSDVEAEGRGNEIGGVVGELARA